MTDARAEAMERKLEWVRQAAGSRFNELELNVIVFTVMLTDDQQAAEQLAERFKATREQMLEIPHCLIGNVDQICESLLHRRERYGTSYISIFEESLEVFAPVVAGLVGK